MCRSSVQTRSGLPKLLPTAHASVAADAYSAAALAVAAFCKIMVSRAVPAAAVTGHPVRTGDLLELLRAAHISFAAGACSAAALLHAADNMVVAC